jgi:L-fucose mutarotase
MLTYPLLHPGLIGALAGAGHGAKVLLADGNYPHSTGSNPAATIIHLNLRPGLLTVTEVLETIQTAIPIEAAAVMASPDGDEVEAHQEYRGLLGVPVTEVERFAFYDLARTTDVAVVVATADQRLCANLLLTIGVRS